MSPNSNNAPSATTGISLFLANKGYHPSLIIYCNVELASEQARTFAIDLDDLHEELKEVIAESQAQIQKYADANWIDQPDFKIGDFAFIKAEHFRTTWPSRKLSEKYAGPFEIIGQAGSRSFIVKLPNSLWSVHPVFHVSMMEPHFPNTIPDRTQSPPPPIEVEGELEYEIAMIVDSRINRKRRCKLEYKVSWAGYQGTSEEFEWLPVTELGHAQELISDFHNKNPDAIGPLDRLWSVFCLFYGHFLTSIM